MIDTGAMEHDDRAAGAVLREEDHGCVHNDLTRA
jgi:hypothetical protein